VLCPVVTGKLPSSPEWQKSMDIFGLQSSVLGIREILLFPAVFDRELLLNCNTPIVQVSDLAYQCPKFPAKNCRETG